MRLTSEFFVGALVRQVFADGGFAAISRKGAAEAGAIMVIVDRLDGQFDLYAPAPQALMAEDGPERAFEKVLCEAERAAIDQRLDRESRMDPDFWIVEIEAREGRVNLPMAEDEPAPPNPADQLFRF